MLLTRAREQLESQEVANLSIESPEWQTESACAQARLSRLWLGAGRMGRVPRVCRRRKGSADVSLRTTGPAGVMVLLLPSPAVREVGTVLGPRLSGKGPGAGGGARAARPQSKLEAGDRLVG